MDWLQRAAKGAKHPPASTIRYLPIIDSSPSDYSTLYTALQQSLKIADELLLEKIILVFDEALYAKIQQIRYMIQYSTQNNFIGLP